jgi:pyruvate/2-oxoglutarate dehydrogenase complex dihydrolipoamide acyltransferase (E2) component
MATKVIMPRIGGTVMEGTIKKWLVKEGDTVARYQTIAEISSEKVTIEVPAPADGVVLKLLFPAGSCVPVGETIALIGGPDETLPDQE